MSDPSGYEALARGAGQGASFGFNEELAARILGALPGPKDPEGLERNYAAGSASQDHENVMRAENAAAQQAHPKTYLAGEFLGSTPSAMVAPQARTVGGGMALGGALGAVRGAGTASPGTRGQGAALGGSLGAMMGSLQAPFARAFSRVPRPVSKAEGVEPVSEPIAPVSHATQTELPLKQPEYAYHNTPEGNIAGIRETGLKIEKGGTNFPFKKNANRSYWTDEASADAWKPKIEDATGSKIAQLRTTKPTDAVPGADQSVRIRTADVTPDRLELKTETGWVPLRSPGLRSQEGLKSLRPSNSPSSQMQLPLERPRNASPPSAPSQPPKVEIPPHPKMKIATFKDEATGETVLVPQREHPTVQIARPRPKAAAAETQGATARPKGRRAG